MLHCEAALASADSLAPAPFYHDPLFDSAHDPEMIYNRHEGCWWILYLQNRYNSPVAPGMPAPLGLTSLTDIGLASTPDRGFTWIYRGIATGLDVPSSERHNELPPGYDSQQYGGATWWRPAVTYYKQVYHGFFVYWEPGRGMIGPDGNGAYANWNLVHYESVGLQHWKYVQMLRRNSFAYDSLVFRTAVGSWILFSTGQNRLVSGAPRPLQSYDLYHWEEALDPTLQHINVDEGPHLSFRDATKTWNGYAWMTWDGSAHRGTGAPNILRSSDGGRTWEQTNQTLYGPPSDRELDVGPAHQGPLVLGQGKEHSKGYAVYFTEFNAEKAVGTHTGCGTGRSVLQFAQVQFNTTGDEWISVNRSVPVELDLTPPEDAEAAPVQDAVWEVAQEDIQVIALAEITRWNPGWFANRTAQGDHARCEDNLNGVAPPLDDGSPACLSQLWRDPDIGARYFVNSTRHANGQANVTWQLEFEASSATSGDRLAYGVKVSGNGVVESLIDRLGSPSSLYPLRQYIYTWPTSQQSHLLEPHTGHAHSQAQAEHS